MRNFRKSLEGLIYHSLNLASLYIAAFAFESLLIANWVHDKFMNNGEENG